MPFKEPWLPLQDILAAIALIERFTAGMDAATFQADVRTVAAVERKLLVISEAAIRLDDQAEALCPGLAWRDIRGIGNWLRHQYDNIDVQGIWRTVVNDLPPLKAAVQRALASRPDSG